ncbi:MAG: hypothetical protein WCL32_01260 [Planctomycetota bacterium]
MPFASFLCTLTPDPSEKEDTQEYAAVGYFLNDLESSISAFALAALMVVGWFAGYWRGVHLSKADREKRDATFSGASMGLLGLLLGFTFSMSLSKHDQRRAMVLADSNAIGDFNTCASLLKEPVRSKLRKSLLAYAQERYDFATKPQMHTIEERIANVARAHKQMQEFIGEAVDEGTPLVEPLVNTFNVLTSSHNSRLAAAFDRLPANIFILLSMAAIITMVLVGDFQGAAEELRYAGTIGFVILTAMVVWVILDLNQPQQGMIRVSQDPMRRVLDALQ